MDNSVVPVFRGEPRFNSSFRDGRVVVLFDCVLCLLLMLGGKEMSRLVKARLDALRILTTHQEREMIDRIVEERTRQDCDVGINKVSDDELKRIVEEARKRLAKKREAIPVYV